MTNKEFFEKVIAMASNDEEMVAIATKALENISKKNAKAKERRMEAQASNEPLLNGIVAYLSEHKSALGSELGSVLGVSTNKAIAMASKLVESGVLTKKEISIPKVGKRMSYSLSAPDDSASNDAESEEAEPEEAEQPASN